MVVQIANENDAECFVVGSFDHNEFNPTYNADVGSFTFTYNNGDNYDCKDDNARTWIPTFQCVEDTEWEVGDVTEEGEATDNTCLYQVTITTKYACQDQIQSCSDSDNPNTLGLGYIFILVLFGGILVYCIVGYFVMGLCVNREGGITDYKDNIPNKSFWCNLPSLVMAGCLYSKEIICGVCSKRPKGENAGENKEDSLIED